MGLFVRIQIELHVKLAPLSRLFRDFLLLFQLALLVRVCIPFLSLAPLILFLSLQIFYPTFCFRKSVCLILGVNFISFFFGFFGFEFPMGGIKPGMTLVLFAFLNCAQAR